MNVNSGISRILVRTPSWIGDAVLSLPALEALKRLYPASGITVLTRKRAAPVFENNPAVADIIEYDSSGRHWGFIRGRLKLSGELKKRDFQMAVLFQNAFDAAFISFVSGIPRRVGYARDLRRRLLTDAIPFTKEIKKRHQACYYLNIVSALGGKEAQPPIPRIYLTEEERAWARGFLKERGIENASLIGAAPGASYGPAKRWTPEGFAEALKRLSWEYRAFPLIFGGREDAESCEAVSQLLRVEHLNLAGKLSLRQFMALLGGLNLFITNDSGPMHLGAAAGVPTVAVFGSTDPALTGPLGTAVKVVSKKPACSPCFKRVCQFGHYNCLKSVEADDVYAAAVSLLKNREKKDLANPCHI